MLPLAGVPALGAVDRVVGRGVRPGWGCVVEFVVERRGSGSQFQVVLVDGLVGQQVDDSVD